MTPDQALAEVSGGKLRPVYLVVGEERLLADQVVKAIHDKAIEGGIEGLNDDALTAPQDKIDLVLATARTLPMLARRRFLLVRGVDKWDSDRPGSAKSAKKAAAASPLDQLTTLAESPPDTTVLVLRAEKLDKRRRLYTLAKKEGWLVSCEPLKRAELPGFIAARVVARGCKISRSHADLLAEISGPELSVIADAVERLCLYVGDGGAIDEGSISELVVKVRTSTVWELVAAVSAQDPARALAALADVYDPSDRGLRLLGVLGWATRQLLRFDQAQRQGLNSSEAAKAAGAPPFKARELETQLRTLSAEALARWVKQLAATDLALKGGSRRPPQAILEQMVLDLCQTA